MICLGNVIKPKSDLLFIRCDRLVTESGNVIHMFYPDVTMKNLFERVSFVEQCSFVNEESDVCEEGGNEVR